MMIRYAVMRLDDYAHMMMMMYFVYELIVVVYMVL